MQFGDTVVIDHLSLEIRSHQITAILAPSGAGKTTLLRLIAGLAKPTAGEIFVDSLPIAGPSQNVGFILQEPSVFPWLTAHDNIRFGLRLKANNRRGLEMSMAVQEIARELEIEHRLGVFASRLSGGEKQRVVIG